MIGHLGRFAWAVRLIFVIGVTLLSQGQACDPTTAPLPVDAPGSSGMPATTQSDQVFGYKPTVPLSTAGAAPSDLSVETSDDGTVQLLWVDNSSDETGFLVRRHDPSGVWTDYAELDANTTTFTDRGAEPRKTYCYQIVARNADRTMTSAQKCIWVKSPPTTGDNETSSAAMPTPEAPYGLVVTAAVSNALDLTWMDASENEEGFLIRRYNGAAGWENVGQVGSGITSFQDQTVQPSRAYCYQVAAFTGPIHSAYSRTGCGRALSSHQDIPANPFDPDPDPQSVRISGLVTAGSKPLSGVQLRASSIPEPVSTSEDGSFAFTVPAGWSGTIEPSLDGYSFSPSEYSFHNAITDLSGQDFGGIPTYYVAPDGLEENDGTFDRPWPNVEYALTQVGGGRTIVLKPGEYPGTITILPEHSGTSSTPTVLKAYQRWTAIVSGGRYADAEHLGVGIYLAAYESARTSWVVLQDLQVCHNEGDGIMVQGDNNVVRGCWIHHNGTTSQSDTLGRSGIGSYGFRGNLFEKNLVEYNGRSWIPGNARDHGLYAFGTRLSIRNNIIRGNVGYGIHVYGASIWGANATDIIGNICYEQANGAGIAVDFGPGGRHVQQIASSSALQPNRVYGNTCWGNARDGITVFGEYSVSPQRIINNISVSNKGYALSVILDNDTGSRVNAVFDYNFVSATRPKGSWYTDAPGSWGLHNVTDDAWPFLNPQYGLLVSTSRARRAGNTEFLPVTDLFGRARSDDPPDIGATPFGDYSVIPWEMWQK